MTVETPGLTAERLAARLGDWPRRKVRLIELQELLTDAEPALAHSTGRRSRLAEVLDELLNAGLVEYPSERSFDHSAQPALPKFVRVTGRAASPSRVSGATIAWRPELAWAAEMTLDRQTLDELLAVNAFIRDGGTGRPIVPMRERSLQLFGNEKRLDTLISGQLFQPGRLTLQQLRCEEVHPPFVYRTIGRGGDVLVIENHHTFVSFVNTLSTDGDVGTVVYGAGAHFKASVTFIADLATKPQRVLYFGDLDIDGLEIPNHANQVAVAAGLPEVEPAHALYRLLLERGTPASVASAPTASRVSQAAGWLHESIRHEVSELLLGGRRIAQEWVGTEALQELAHEPSALG